MGTYNLYEKPLRRLMSVQLDETRSLFDWVEPICSVSNLVLIKLHAAMDTWDSQQTRIGNAFSRLLWTQYENYQVSLRKTVLPILRDKEAHDVEFVALCKMRRGAVKYTLHDFLHLPLERLLQYDQYLCQLSSATPKHHPDYGDLSRAAQKARSMVRRGEPGKEETDLDRIQDLFPGDNLRLNERDPLSPRKGLLRSRSVAASKLHRALSGKSKSTTDILSLSPKETNCTVLQDGDRNWMRFFIMDGPAQFSIGLQNQERHLFLLSDILLVAKPKASGNYKLKEKVRTCEMWLSNCLSDVSESTRSSDTSFVLGWPTTNVVVTFSSSATRDLWHNQFTQLIAEAKEKEGRQLTSLQISYWDPVSQTEYLQTVRIGNTHTTKDCIYLCIQKINGVLNAEEFQMWVKTGKEEAPYPLIGHEYPYCIKMNFIRELLQSSGVDPSSLADVVTDCKCLFVLRRNYHKATINHAEKKKVRRPAIINWPFRRQATKQSSVDSGTSPVAGGLFGRDLCKVSPGGTVPKPIMALLRQLFLRGPFTYGIFRKSGNVRAKRELQSRLEEDPDLNLDDVPIHVVAATFKEFLGCLPDSLLQRNLYPEWLRVLQVEPAWKKRDFIISLLKKLPPANVELLRHFLCVLWHIGRRSSENKMPASNLAVCVGPSLLSPEFVDGYHSPTLRSEVSEQVPRLVEHLIEHGPDIFGREFLRLFGDPPQKDPSRQDSGAEESDGLQENGSAFRRDDSSIDSLERALMDDSSPKLPNRTKVSLTNLSRDSGLTLSDTQLYTPEEDEVAEVEATSLRAMTKSVPHLDYVGGESPYGRSNGVSIDGSCHDVVRRRRCEVSRNSRPPQSICGRGGGRSQQLQYSKSCRDSVEDSVDDDFPTNDAFVRWRKSRGRKQRGPVASTAVDISHSSLLRSASEESLLQKYMGEDAIKRRGQHCKGAAPTPPTDVESTVPDRHAVWFANHNRTVDWKRSQSTSKIDEIDHGTTSAAAPGVSVPNRRELRVTEHELPAVHVPPRVNSACSSTSDGSQHSRRSQRSDGSWRSRGSHKPVEPPSYQEAIGRRSVLQRSLAVADETVTEQASLGSKARRLYEDSLQRYNHQLENQSDTHHAILVKVDSGDEGIAESPPPLPPKPAVHRTVSDGVRLRHHPPVHVKDSQLANTSGRKCVVVTSFRDRCRNRELYDFPVEISWSVAQLRNLFSNDASSRDVRGRGRPLPGGVLGGEESYV